MARLRLAGKTGPVHSRVQRIAGAVAGEHSPGAIGTVRARRQSHHPQAGVPVAEAGDGFAPVRPVAVGASLFTGYLLTPGHQSRAGAAGDEHLIQRFPRILFPLLRVSKNNLVSQSLLLSAGSKSGFYLIVKTNKVSHNIVTTVTSFNVQSLRWEQPNEQTTHPHR